VYDRVHMGRALLIAVLCTTTGCLFWPRSSPRSVSNDDQCSTSSRLGALALGSGLVLVSGTLIITSAANDGSPSRDYDAVRGTLIGTGALMAAIGAVSLAASSRCKNRLDARRTEAQRQAELAQARRQVLYEMREVERGAGQDVYEYCQCPDYECARERGRGLDTRLRSDEELLRAAGHSPSRVIRQRNLFAKCRQRWRGMESQPPRQPPPPPPPPPRIPGAPPVDVL